MNTPLQLVNIQKHFKDGDNEIEILKDLNLSVEKGEFVAVVGPSGSGKVRYYPSQVLYKVPMVVKS